MTLSTRTPLRSQIVGLVIDVTAGVVRELLRSSLDHRQRVAQADDRRCVEDLAPISRRIPVAMGREVRGQVARVSVGTLAEAALHRHQASIRA